MKRIMLTALLALGACAPMAASDKGDTLVVWNDSGALFSAADEERRWLERGLEYRRIEIAGTCASSCAFGAFMLPQTCYREGARIGLHPYSYLGLVPTEATRRATADRVALLPQGLQDWWATHDPGTLGADLTFDDLERLIPERRC